MWKENLEIKNYSLEQINQKRWEIFQNYQKSQASVNTDPILISILNRFELNLREWGESIRIIDELENIQWSDQLILANFLAHILISACEGDINLALEVSKPNKQWKFVWYYSNTLNTLINARLTKISSQ